MKQKKSERIINILTVFSVLVIVWIMFSFLEVNAKNVRPNPEYTKYNFFVMMTEAAEK